jgi:sugar phosphate isomerase/epimerase
MQNRRDLLKLSAVLTAGAFIPSPAKVTAAAPKGPFRFCLNTSTISGQNPGLLHAIEIAAEAGYDGIELWINDIKEYLKHGNSIQSLASFLSPKNIAVENAISFTEWLVNDDEKRKAALAELEEEMKLMTVLGCRRIAAPPAGVNKDEPMDFEKAGARYRQILSLGRKYKVMPQLEFWGASGTLFNLSQTLAIAAAANDRDARILPDIYHLFRGGSGFEGLNLVNGKAIEIIHVNDYPSSKPVNEQTDSDRVYPGNGAAPLKQVLRDLKNIGGTKVLSLELFNETYWKQDALLVAKTGLKKMKSLVNEITG